MVDLQLLSNQVTELKIVTARHRQQIADLDAKSNQRLLERIELQDVKIGELITQLEQLKLVSSELQEEIASIKLTTDHD